MRHKNHPIVRSFRVSKSLNFDLETVSLELKKPSAEIIREAITMFIHQRRQEQTLFHGAVRW